MDAPALEVERRQRQLLWLAIMNTAIVGSGVWIVSLAQPEVTLLHVVTMIQVLYQVGALVNASTHPPTFITGLWINIGSMIVFWLSRGFESWPVSLSLLALVSLATRFSYQLSSQFSNSVRIKFENATLLNQVQAQVLEAEAARAAAERANAAKSQFLAGASHDLRQPLHSMLIFASLLDRASSEQRGEYLRQLRSAASSLERLLNGLLDLSRLESNTFSVTIKTLQIREVLESVIEQARIGARTRGLGFSLDVPDVYVRSDPLLLERIVRNLLDNAVKYTRQGSVSLRVVTEQDTVHLKVEDTGPGIARDDQKRIFQEFERLRQSGSDVEDGFGLGLAIVARGCALLGHDLTLESDQGRGSCFVLSIARAADDEVAKADLPIMVGSGVFSTGRNPVLSRAAAVLIIDDNSGILAAMSAIVESIGGRCFEVDTAQALERFLGQDELPPLDALIADYRLRGEPIGLQLVERVRERYPGIPGALVTADHEAAHAEKGTEDIAILPKPVDNDVLIDWLMTAIEREDP